MVEVVLVLVILLQMYLGYVERKELNDRLMAKSLAEFKSEQVKDEANALPDEDGTIPIEEAGDELNGES